MLFSIIYILFPANNGDPVSVYTLVTIALLVEVAGERWTRANIWETHSAACVKGRFTTAYN